ncbi:hypothetical protein V8G54_000359 [Vigna mungo]|uniref:Uncharacterized protein n=1 Tax=Vigna mungo TaxID=3915 RepID=A0AAQ3P5G1_VIGMU
MVVSLSSPLRSDCCSLEPSSCFGSSSPMSHSLPLIYFHTHYLFTITLIFFFALSSLLCSLQVEIPLLFGFSQLQNPSVVSFNSNRSSLLKVEDTLKFPTFPTRMPTKISNLESSREEDEGRHNFQGQNLDLGVYKPLKLTLELVKKEMEINKIQVIMSLAFLYVLN